jgi:hypothetical protein
LRVPLRCLAEEWVFPEVDFFFVAAVWAVTMPDANSSIMLKTKNFFDINRNFTSESGRRSTAQHHVTV